MKNSVTMGEILQSVNPHPDPMPKDMLKYFEKDENGMYPYLIAAWRAAGEEAWRLGAFPSPFEKVTRIFQNHDFNPAELHCVMDGMRIAHPEFIGYFWRAHAYMMGWNTGAANLWYAPFQQIPRYSNIEQAPQTPIDIRLMSIEYGALYLKFVQGNESVDARFGETLMDSLPLWGILLSSLKKNGYGHATVADEGAIYSLRIWSEPDGSAYMNFRGFNASLGNEANCHWTAMMPLKNVIVLFENLFKQIQEHPDFASQYACYSCWLGDKPLAAQLETALKGIEDNPDEDLQRKFELSWLRENVMKANGSPEAYQMYESLLRDLQIPDYLLHGTSVS